MKTAFVHSSALFALLAAIALAAPIEPSAAPSDIASILKEGRDILNTGDDDRALKYFMDAYNAAPKDADLATMYAFCLRKTGRFEEARKTYLKALHIKPDHPQAREYLGECYLQLAREQLIELRKAGESASKECEALVLAFRAFADAVEADDVALPERRW